MKNILVKLLILTVVAVGTSSLANELACRFTYSVDNNFGGSCYVLLNVARSDFFYQDVGVQVKYENNFNLLFFSITGIRLDRAWIELEFGFNNFTRYYGLAFGYRW
jgi:hypothetical protein